jgi:hypothetical protein
MGGTWIGCQIVARRLPEKMIAKPQSEKAEIGMQKAALRLAPLPAFVILN